MIVRNEDLPAFELPGLVHRTIAGHAQGVRSMEVWLQTMGPRSETPVHRHACEEVILILSGAGEVIVEDERKAFGAGTTLIVPPDAVHQIVNPHDQPLALVAALGAAPVRVRTADGAPLPVPWAAPEG